MKLITYNHILMTHDGSILASAAIPHTVTLAKQYQAKVLLLRVVPTLSEEYTAISAPTMYPILGIGNAAHTLYEAHKKVAAQELRKIEQMLMQNGVATVEVRLEEGSAKYVIVELAKKRHCDLIVMSTHGRSGLGRTLLGSVTDYVIHHGNCPVLAVHQNRKLTIKHQGR